MTLQVYPYSYETDSLFGVTLASEMAACVLAWHYFHDTEPPKLLKHIQDRDLWN